jgi:hypothetical protein
LHLNNQDINVKLVDTTAKISFVNSPKKISQSFAFMGLWVLAPIFGKGFTLQKE